METMMRTGALPMRIAGGCRCTGAVPVRCARQASPLSFEARDASTVLLRAERRTTPSLLRCEARAEQSSGVNEVAKGDATAAQLLQEAEEDESIAAGDSGAVDVLSSTAAESPQPATKFFTDVEVEAQEAASNVGRAVEGAAATLDDKAEEAGSAGRGRGKATTALARRKAVDAAADGYEVLKWIAEGFVTASKNAQQTLSVAKELLDKRLKSFGIAADDTRSVSSQVADVAQKKFRTFHGSASKFGQEFKVNLEEKKAADSLKPESEASPLTKIGKGLQENLTKATAQDGPLAKVGGTLSEGFSKVSQAGQELASKASKKGEELATAASRTGEEITSEAKKRAEATSEKADGTGDDFVFNFDEAQKRNGNVTGDTKSD